MPGKGPKRSLLSLPSVTLVPPKTVIQHDSGKVYLIVSGRIGLYAPDDFSSVRLERPFKGFSNPKTEALEMNKRIGKHILTKECSPESPF